jgi:hypothetical protein
VNDALNRWLCNTAHVPTSISMSVMGFLSAGGAMTLVSVSNRVILFSG